MDMTLHEAPDEVRTGSVPDRRILVLTGRRGSGKTTACLELIEDARRHGLDCAGLVSPARIENGRRTGSDVVDVRTGERGPFAFAVEDEGGVRRHRFDDDVATWARARLDAACPCRLLVVDELGPLELELGLGWPNALDILRAADFGIAVVVVRPWLVGAFLALLGGVMPGQSDGPVVVMPEELRSGFRMMVGMEREHAKLGTRTR